MDLVATVKTNVVLIIDEVQQALLSDDGKHLLHALKAARDAVNAQPDAPTYLLFLGTGSHKSLVTDTASRRSQPFTGGIAAHHEVLGWDFVERQMQRLYTVADPFVREVWRRRGELAAAFSPGL